MARKIDTLLNKKKWKGDELGKILMSSVIHDIKQVKEGKEPKPLFNQADFEALEGSLNTNTDYMAYGIYTDIYSSIIDSYNRGQAQYQQFLQSFHRLLHYLTQLENADKAELSLSNQPYIVTEKQYNDLLEMAQSKKDNYKESYTSLFFSLLSGAIDLKEYSPKELVDAVAEYENIPATDNKLIERYFDIYNTGYYILENGKRSDELTQSEWQEEKDNQILEHFSLIINGQPASKEETLKTFKMDKTRTKAELFFKGVEGVRKDYKAKTGQDLEESDEEIQNALDYFTFFDEVDETHPRINHIIEDMLDYQKIEEHRLYKDIDDFKANITMLNTLEALIATAEEGSEKEALKEVKKQYPKLYTLINKYIEEALPAVKNLKANQLYTDKFTWKELSEVIPLYRHYRSVQIHDIEEAFRETTTITETRRGIAIIKDPHPNQIDDKGYYIQPKSPLYYTTTLETIIKDIDTVEEIEGLIYRLINPAIAYLYAFNSLIDILQNVYEISDLDTLKTDLTTIESRVKAYNSMLHLFYVSVRGSNDTKAVKREILKNLFQEINIEELKPSEEAFKKVQAEIDELGLTEKAKKRFRYLDPFINALLIDTKGAFYE